MRRLALALPLLLLPLAACSGDDEGNSGPSLQERRNAYVASAEGACKKANDEFSQLTFPKLEQVPATVDSFAATATAMVAEVKALEPPAEDREELQEKVLDPLQADLDAALALGDDAKAAAAAGDGGKVVGLLGRLPEPSADLEFMTDYGFVQCVEVADLASKVTG